MFLLGKTAWYVTPLGLFVTTTAGVPGTGSAANARPAVTAARKSEERIVVWCEETVYVMQSVKDVLGRNGDLSCIHRDVVYGTSQVHKSE